MDLLSDLTSPTIAATSTDVSHLLDRILPQKRGHDYTIEEIESIIKPVRSEIEMIQHEQNTIFDETLSPTNRSRLDNLYRNLHTIQLDTMKLQCDIAFTKEQLESVHAIKDNEAVRMKRNLIDKELELKSAIKITRFKIVQTFVDGLTRHISDAVSVCHKPSGIGLQFDWPKYNRVLMLSAACGKTLVDLTNIERLYQQDDGICEVTSKLSAELMDFSNFVSYPSKYNLGSLIEIHTKSGARFELREYLNIAGTNRTDKASDERYLADYRQKLLNLARDSCGLLMDMNIDYIENQLTSGINIDMLNGASSNTYHQPEDQNIPSYAFAPGHYICQVGQHILTLKRQTDSADVCLTQSEHLRYAFGLADPQKLQLDLTPSNTISHIILSYVAHRCIRSLLGRTTNSVMNQLTASGRAQLSTDVAHLSSILEDLQLLDPDDGDVQKLKNLLNH